MKIIIFTYCIYKMPGGLIQVIARGTQDAYLTVKPQITQWKAVYRRHTIFATESIEQVFNGTGDFGKKVVCNIQRNGDLITKMYLRLTLPALKAGQCWCPRIGHAMIKTLELNVGGTAVEKQTGDWLNVVHELYRDFAHDRGYDEMIGNTDDLTTIGGGTLETVLYIPLQFFCCRHDGLAIPLIATQYHDTRVEVEFNPISQLVCHDGRNSHISGSMGTCSLFVDYVYLGAVERKKFAQASHEYLIEQVQYAGGESVTSQSQKFRLDFNHPCKALHVSVQQDKYTNGSKFMAWNPKDWNQTKVDATKRICMAWGKANASGYYVAKAGVGATLTAAILAARVVGTDVSGTDMDILDDKDALMVLGSLMGDNMISQTVDFLTSDVGHGNTSSRTATGDGAHASDITVFDHTNYGVFLNGKVNPVKELLVQLNGSERLSKRDGTYFNYVQSFQCYNVTPCDGLNSLSFALDPTKHQPSGSCNMSRIDNASVHIDFIGQALSMVGGVATKVSVVPYSAAKCNIYSPNYNVFRVMGGMAGMGFSN
jgi:hypothetical protein